VPLGGFFEWKAIRGQKAKQPYAIAMKDSRPFGIGGIESWKDPGERRMDQDIRDHHHRCQLARGRRSRPDAIDPSAGELRPLA
jgi:putative SOS response-associated peptidase YedK